MNDQNDIQTPASDPAASAPITTIKIDRIDLVGKGQTLRIFVKSKSGKLLSAKVRGDGATFTAGMEVPLTDVLELAPASKIQISRYNGASGASLDFDLLD
jgi:hypothetical protein